MAKIAMKNPIVEIDGDELTRIMWKVIKNELILPYIDLNTEYYDLGVLNRDSTNDQITIDAANAIKKHKVGVKCATITPDADRVKEYNLKSEYKSPNGTIRGMLDGTVFRAPIIIKNIPLSVRSWKYPIHIARHAHGDVYKNQEIEVPGPGIGELVFTSEDGTVIKEKIADFKGPGVMQGIFNLDSSIESFAKSCFMYALEKKIDVLFSAKHTISKTYDKRFVDIFDNEFKTNWKEKFEEKGLKYSYKLIDAAADYLMKTEGGYLWALKNYDGDVKSDLIGSGFGSIALMTSELVSPHGYFEFEATHGTIQDQYYDHKEGKDTHANSTALNFAWARAFKKRGELDNTPELIHYGNALEEATTATIEDGLLTRDLIDVATPSEKNSLVTTKDFIYGVRDRLEQRL